MDGDQKAKFVQRLNSKIWWHVTPETAPHSYEVRGRFYASTYRDAEFYGRPSNIPDRVFLTNPLIGTEEETNRLLFGKPIPVVYKYEAICAQDAARRARAFALGFDSIAVISPLGMKRFLSSGTIPLGIELCLIELSLSRKAHPRDFMRGWKSRLEIVGQFYTQAGILLAPILESQL